MGNFNRSGSSRGGYRGGFGGGGRRSFGGHNNYGRDDRRTRQMFDVVCSSCGKDCQVPFEPTGEKPVYCSDCFEKTGGRDHKRSFDRPRYDDRGSSDNGNKAQFESLNAKLDKILSLLQVKKEAVAVEESTSSAESVVEKPADKKETKPKKAKKSSKEKVATPEV